MDNLIKNYVGVDVSKKSLDVYIHPVGKKMKIDNSINGIEKLKNELTKFKVEQIVYEASGGHEKLLIKELGKTNHNHWIVDPRRIKGFIASEGVKCKTDAIDAKMIALFSSQKSRNYDAIILSDEQEKLKAYMNRRNDFVENLSTEKNRIDHPSHKLFQKNIEKHIKYLEKEIKTLDDAIAEMIKQNDDFKRKAEILKSVPGVGIVTTSSLLSYLPELGLVTCKQISAITGVSPYVNQSGQYKGKSFIKGGRPAARKALYMAALTAARHNEVLREFYERLISKGKAVKVALIAVMRKLITILNAMIKKGELWNPT